MSNHATYPNPITLTGKKSCPGTRLVQPGHRARHEPAYRAPRVAGDLPAAGNHDMLFVQVAEIVDEHRTRLRLFIEQDDPHGMIAQGVLDADQGLGHLAVWNVGAGQPRLNALLVGLPFR